MIMETISTLIVDDEPLARERLRVLLGADPEVEVAGECADGFEAEEAIRSLAPDLVFLDVQMPERDGFGVVEAVGVDRFPVVVFVTAYDQHALRAFEVHALDYLLKPFDEERFARTLARAKAQVRSVADGDVQRRVLSLVEELRARPAHLERVMVKTGGHLAFVRTDEIDWIKAEGNYVRLHAGGAAYMLRETISNLEAQLDPERFLRIPRSTIVNLDRVAEIHPLFHGEYRVVLRDGTKLTLSRGYRDRLPR